MQQFPGRQRRGAPLTPRSMPTALAVARRRDRVGDHGEGDAPASARSVVTRRTSRPAHRPGPAEPHPADFGIQTWPCGTRGGRPIAVRLAIRILVHVALRQVGRRAGLSGSAKAALAWVKSRQGLRPDVWELAASQQGGAAVELPALLQVARRAGAARGQRAAALTARFHTYRAWPSGLAACGVAGVGYSRHGDYEHTRLLTFGEVKRRFPRPEGRVSTPRRPRPSGCCSSTIKTWSGADSPWCSAASRPHRRPSMVGPPRSDWPARSRPDVDAADAGPGRRGRDPRDLPGRRTAPGPHPHHLRPGRVRVRRLREATVRSRRYIMAKSACATESRPSSTPTRPASSLRQGPSKHQGRR